MEAHDVFLLLVMCGGSIFLIFSKGNILEYENSRRVTGYQLKADVGYILPIIRHLSTLNDIVDFEGYGCWCNSAHIGKAVDVIDSCCKSHYQCYKKLAENHRCTSAAMEYSMMLCPGDVRCHTNEAVCTRGSCECDVTLGKCIIWSISTYNERYNNHNQTLCARNFTLT